MIDKSADEIRRYLDTVSQETFVESAQALLQLVEDPFLLAELGQRANERQHGGVYFQALFWHRAHVLCNAELSRFKEVCRSQSITLGKGQKLARAGQLLCNLQDHGLDISVLRHSPNRIVDSAIRQNGRASEYLLHASSILAERPDVSHYTLHNLWCMKNGGIKANLDIIKPSDWWAFGRPKWLRDEDFPGSIPGEVYANALYYFAPSEGVAVDPMAGSGMLKRVYDDKPLWQRERNFNLTLRLYDLHPKRPYIEERDARRPLEEEVDWIFLDPPYFGQSEHLYGGALARAVTYTDYLSELKQVINAMSLSLRNGGRLCLLLPKWSGTNIEDLNHNVPYDAYAIAIESGLNWIDSASVSRGRQQESGGAMMNERAKRIQRMRSDTCILNVFERAES